MNNNSQTYYGLPADVIFCKRCVMSNQRPSSTAEFKHTTDRKATTLHIDSSGICDACRYAKIKDEINWTEREDSLLKLLDQHRRNDGYYDCVVPGSGGKDSVFAAHILKSKYGMHPLTVTWPPLIYTDYGLDNFKAWLDVGGFDNITLRPNGHVNKLLTKLSIENLLHPFHCFILGQKNLAPKIASKYKIPLIFYGESEAEYGNPIVENSSSLRDASYYTARSLNDMYISGVSVSELQEKYNLSLNDLSVFLPPLSDDIDNTDIEVHYLGYYIKWTPQEAYYYAVENTGFKPRPFRTEGTYSKYNSIDDKLDDLHFYTTYIKFGLGRATYDASQEIRNNHITRDEGVALVDKFDGEFPNTYFNEVMDYIGMNPESFFQICDKFRSPHLWEFHSGKWRLKYQVS